MAHRANGSMPIYHKPEQQQHEQPISTSPISWGFQKIWQILCTPEDSGRNHWRIQDFPEKGAPTAGGRGGANIRICQIFPKTAWNWKNLDPGRGGVPCAPLRSATGNGKSWTCSSPGYMEKLKCNGLIRNWESFFQFRFTIINSGSLPYFLTTLSF